MARRLEVQILGDASSLERALARSRRSTESFGSSLERGLGGIGRAFRTIGRDAAFAAGAAGVGAFFAVLHEGTNEIKESQQTLQATQAVIKSTGGIAGVTADQIEQLGLHISNLSGFDDEAVKHGANLLLTFRNIRNEQGKGNDIFNRSVLALANMAAAFQDTGEKGSLGAAGNANFQATAIRLGKALNDPVKGLTALRRVGVQFTKQQQEQIKTLVASGKTLAAQRIILRELAIEFGGQAAAKGKTLAGQLGVLHARFKDLSGELLSGFVPAFTRAITALTGFVRQLAAAKGFRAKLSIVWDGVRAAASNLWDLIVRAFSDVVTNLRARLTVVFDGISEVSRTLAAAIGTAVSQIDWDRVWAQARGIADGLQRQLERVDFGFIGRRIGAGISSAARVALPAARDIAARVGKAVATVDWVAVGKAIGPGLAAAVATAFITLLDPNFWIKNWQLTLSVAIAAFPVGRLARVGEVLGGALIRPLARVFPRLAVALERGLVTVAIRVAETLGRFDLLGPMLRAIRFGIDEVPRIIATGLARAGALALRVLDRVFGGIAARLLSFFRARPVISFLVRVLGINAAIGALVQLGRKIGQAFHRVGDDIAAFFRRLLNQIKTWALEAALFIVQKLDISVAGHHLIPGVHGLVRRLQEQINSLKDPKPITAHIQQRGLEGVKRGLDSLKDKTVTITVATIQTPSGTLPAGIARGDRGATGFAVATARHAATATAQARPFTKEPPTPLTTKQIDKAFTAMINRAELALSKAQLTPGLRDDIKALEAEKALVERQLALHKGDLTIQQKLVDVQGQLNAANQAAFQRTQQVRDVALSRAQLTPALNDDLRILRQQRAAIEKQIALHKDDLDLRQALVDVDSRIADANRAAFQQSFQQLDLALSKAQLTPRLSDDLRVLEKQRSALQKQVQLHKDDLDLRQQLVGVQSQINSLNQQAVQDAKSVFGSLFTLSTDVNQQAKILLGGTAGRTQTSTTSAEALRKTADANIAAFRAFTRNLAILQRRGAPAGLIQAARTGEITPDQVAALAKANTSTLKAVFRDFRIANRLITNAAKAEVHAKTVTMHATRVVLPAGVLRGDRGRPPQAVARAGGTVFIIENLHTDARNGKELERDLQKKAGRRGGSRRGVRPGVRSGLS